MQSSNFVRPFFGLVSIALLVALVRAPVHGATGGDGRGGGRGGDHGADHGASVEGVGAATSRAIAMPSPVAPADALAWVADHDADRVVLLDEDLVERAAVDVPCPVRVQARRDGAAWVVAPKGCGLGGRHDLCLVRASGGVARLLSADPVRDLACLDGGDALVLEGSWSASSTRLLRVTATGSAREVAVWSDASAVAGAGDRVLIGTVSGTCLVFDASAVHGPVLARRGLGVEISDLAPAPGGEWWVLGGASGTRLWRLRADLSVRFVRDLGGTLVELAATPLEAVLDRVFLPRSGIPWALAIDGDGRAPFDVDLTGVGTPIRGDGLADGGALLVLGGALVRVDRRGQVAAVQGGFDWSLDASAVPRPAP